MHFFGWNNKPKDKFTIPQNYSIITRITGPGKLKFLLKQNPPIISFPTRTKL
jgi:hypothetical protein